MKLENSDLRMRALEAVEGARADKNVATPDGAVVVLEFLLAIFPAKIEVWGVLFWTPAPAPRTPQDVLLIHCPAIAAGQASRGTTSWRPHIGRDFA
eukprot:1152857-Pelagomonas_calceolata.AAC.1